MNNTSGFQIGAQAPRYYESEVSLFMAPFVDSLVKSAVKKGDAVLDVASGTGFAARAASVTVGPGGHVVGSDINPGMVAMAQEVPHDGGCEIVWRQASALELPFEDDSFDAVISQQGIQFFPDIPAGLREMVRVTRKGGRLAATVWAPRHQSPYLDAIFGMLSEHCNGNAGANTAWQAGGGENQVKDWFNATGLGHVNIELVETVVSMPPISDYVPDHLQALPPPSLGSFFGLSHAAQEELLESLDNQLGAYRADHGFEMPFRSYLATANL